MKSFISLISRVLLLICLAVIFPDLQAQRIRKDHREMTPGEKQAYILALTAKFNDNTLQDMANHHSNHFGTEIHTTGGNNGTQFLSWHRVFQLELEQKLRAAGTAKAEYITVPYWDWRIENSNANVTWDDNGFLSNSFVSTWSITRLSPLSGTLASSTNVSDMLAMTGNILPTTVENANSTSPWFSKRLEHWHNLGHVFIGGTMNSGASPRDPIFFLHHGFVDKLWQDWEDRDNAVQSVLPTTALIHYNLIAPNSIIDSRVTYYQDDNNNIFQQDVWYAYNKKVLLDGLNGDFSVTGTNKLYCYVAWNGSAIEGTIYSGDVMRDGSDNVVADSKGGFIVTNGSQCDFRAATAIILRPGFTVQAGGAFTAALVSTPCGYTSNTSASRAPDLITNVETPVADAKTQVFPNPFYSAGLNIRFNMTQYSSVSIRIINGLGQTVAQPMSSQALNAGSHIVKWTPDAKLASGIYYCIIQTSSSREVIKLVYYK
jgi:tyrosinase